MLFEEMTGFRIWELAEVEGWKDRMAGSRIWELAEVVAWKDSDEAGLKVDYVLDIDTGDYK